MKTRATAAALLLCAVCTCVMAQRRYEQLTPSEQNLYNECTDQAASKPTQEGVKLALAGCNRKFLSGSADAQADLESMARAAAEAINRAHESKPPPEALLRMNAKAVGTRVVVHQVLGGPEFKEAMPDDVKKAMAAAVLGTLCSLATETPEFKSGGISFQILLDVEGQGRIADVVVTQRKCDVL